MLRVGEQAKLDVEALDRHGQPIGGLGAPAWSTSDDRVVSLRGNGNVRGESVGRASVTAMLRGRSVSALVEVRAR